MCQVGACACPKFGTYDAQVGQPVVRVARGKLQLGVVLDTRASSLLVAVVVPSRIAPGTTVDKSQVKWVLLEHLPQCPSVAAHEKLSPSSTVSLSTLHLVTAVSEHHACCSWAD